MTRYAQQLKADAERKAQVAARFAGMTDAAIAGELLVLMAESAELTRTWGRDGSDAWCSTQAVRLNEKIAIARSVLAERNMAHAA
jgi:hypothetical protein